MGPSWLCRRASAAPAVSGRRLDRGAASKTGRHCVDATLSSARSRSLPCGSLRLGGCVADHRLGPKELFQLEISISTAVSGLLVAPKWSSRVSGRVVNVHVARSHPGRDAACMVEVPGLHIRGQPSPVVMGQNVGNTAQIAGQGAKFDWRHRWPSCTLALDTELATQPPHVQSWMEPPRQPSLSKASHPN